MVLHINKHYGPDVKSMELLLVLHGLVYGTRYTKTKKKNYFVEPKINITTFMSTQKFFNFYKLKYSMQKNFTERLKPLTLHNTTMIKHLKMSI